MRVARWFPLVVALIINDTVSGQITSIERVPQGSPMVDSLPTNQFPRGGSYLAVIEGFGLLDVGRFVSSEPWVQGRLLSFSDTRLLVEITSTKVSEANKAFAPIPGVSFTLFTWSSTPIDSGPVTFDIVAGPAPKVLSWKITNDIKWISGGSAAIVDYESTIQHAGNISHFYIGGPEGGVIKSWTTSGGRFSTTSRLSIEVTAPKRFEFTDWPTFYGAVDGAGQGAPSDNNPENPSPPLHLPVIQTQLVDPVFSLLRGPRVTDDPELLGNLEKGRIVVGAAADGVSTLVVRVAGAPPGQELSLTITEDGSVAQVGSTNFGKAIELQADSQGKAFYQFRAPVNFARPGGPDDDRGARLVDVEFQSSDNPGVVGNTEITIVRPPVVFVHGQWDNGGTWAAFLGELRDKWLDLPSFYNLVDYSRLIPGITSTSPAYSQAIIDRLGGSSMGSSYNTPIVLEQIKSHIWNFKELNNVAAIQADIVAHSFGGLIVRGMKSLRDYAPDSTFRKGSIHKLITLGTPHLGTPLATQLLSDDNSCVRNILARRSKASLESATIASSRNTEMIETKYTGSVGDMKGDGSGGELSDALARIQRVGGPLVPSAMIVGVMNSSNLGNLDCRVCAATVIRLCIFSPLARMLTADNWPTLLTPESDAIVPRRSAQNGGRGIALNGVIHSQGVTSLGFSGLDFFDPASHAPERVKQLLNEPTTGPNFEPL